MRRAFDNSEGVHRYEVGILDVRVRNCLDALNAVSSLTRFPFGADGQKNKVTLCGRGPGLEQWWRP